MIASVSSAWRCGALSIICGSLCFVCLYDFLEGRLFFFSPALCFSRPVFFRSLVLACFFFQLRIFANLMLHHRVSLPDCIAQTSKLFLKSLVPLVGVARMQSNTANVVSSTNSSVSVHAVVTNQLLPATSPQKEELKRLQRLIRQEHRKRRRFFERVSCISEAEFAELLN